MVIGVSCNERYETVASMLFGSCWKAGAPISWSEKYKASLKSCGFLDGGGGGNDSHCFYFKSPALNMFFCSPPSTPAWCLVPYRFYRKNKHNITKPNWNIMQKYTYIHSNNVHVRIELIKVFTLEKSNQLQIGNQVFLQYQVPQLLHHEEPPGVNKRKKKWVDGNMQSICNINICNVLYVLYANIVIFTIEKPKSRTTKQRIENHEVKWQN